MAVLEDILESLECSHADEFRSGFIAESPQKLRRILQYFAAVQGRGSYPSVRCNAPEFSAVIDAHGRAQPCFFISGPPAAALHGGLSNALNSDAMVALREDIRAGNRAECKTCVCSMWRDLNTVETSILPVKSALEVSVRRLPS